MRERYKGAHSESSANEQRLQARLEQVAMALQNTQNQLLQKESSVSSQSRVIEELKEQARRLESELTMKGRENENLMNELQQYEIEVLAGSTTADKGPRHGSVSVSAMKMELEQLRKDNARLTEMLKKTKKYADFGNFVEDSGGQAIRVPPPSKDRKQGEEEAQQWVPQEAFTMAHAFRMQHGNDLSPDLINQLL